MPGFGYIDVLSRGKGVNGEYKKEKAEDLGKNQRTISSDQAGRLRQYLHPEIPLCGADWTGVPTDGPKCRILSKEGNEGQGF